MKEFCWILVLVMTMGVLGCETMKGVGKDVENTGNNIQDLINRADEEMQKDKK